MARVDRAFKPVPGTDFALDIVVYRGAGSYVCGEASGLITSIEGRKPYPRNRPPRLTVRGLFQKPTVINNVESLANITGIIRMGAEEFRFYADVAKPAPPPTQPVTEPMASSAPPPPRS